MLWFLVRRTDGCITAPMIKKKVVHYFYVNHKITFRLIRWLCSNPFVALKNVTILHKRVSLREAPCVTKSEKTGINMYYFITEKLYIRFLYVIWYLRSAKSVWQPCRQATQAAFLCMLCLSLHIALTLIFSSDPRSDPGLLGKHLGLEPK